MCIYIYIYIHVFNNLFLYLHNIESSIINLKLLFSDYFNITGYKITYKHIV